MSRREGLIAAAALAVGIAVLPLLGGGVLWTRPLWFDELCCVAYVVADAASPAEVVRRVAHSWDYAPPLLHLLVWPFARLAGGEVTPALLHTVSVSAVALALLLTYGTLRRRFTRLASVAGTLAVAGHPLVIAHAFEGRFYGPWLLFAVGVAWSFGLRSRRARDAATALFSILLCAIHWFGVFSLGLLVAGAVVLVPGSPRERLRLVAPTAAGALVLAALAPMALAQRSDAAPYLWLPPLSGAQLLEIARLFWLAAVPIAAVVLLLGDVVRRRSVRDDVRDAVRAPDTGPMLCLGLMPLVLIVVSLLLQPAMLGRYGIAAVAAWGPLVAIALTLAGPVVRVAGAAGLAMILLINGARAGAERREFAHRVGRDAAAFEAAKARGLPIVFWGLHSIYPVAGPQRSPGTLARYLDLPDSTITALFPADAMEPVRRKYLLDRDQARGHARTYGFPRLAPKATLDSATAFLLLVEPLALPGGYKRPEAFGRALFPAHRVTRVSELVTLFERSR